MNAEHADLHARIREAFSTRMALTASDVRIDDHQLTLGELASLGRLRYMRRKLMPKHARIFKEWLTSFVDMVVGAADADASDIQPYFTMSRRHDRSPLQNEIARSTADNGSHF
jgi:hypothetical protein